MVGVFLVQAGLVVLIGGLVAAAASMAGGLVFAGTGLIVLLAGVLAPARDQRVRQAASHLDTYAPAWQFRERHALSVAAAPARAYDAVRTVTAREIRGFRLLTWLRRGGRALPEGILNAPADAPILDVALSGGFHLLADDPPREVVVGMIVVGHGRTFSGDVREPYRTLAAPGFAKASLHFLVEDDGRGGSVVSTETRVYATSAAARRRFAVYWRIIQPGSAFIRRMWLRAIRRRAEGPAITPLA